jgi:hypothetical protein
VILGPPGGGKVGVEGPGQSKRANPSEEVYSNQPQPVVASK